MWVLLSQARPGHGPPDRADAWTTTEHLLASAVDLLANLVWTTRAVNMKRPGKPPEPLRRPGDPVKAPPPAGARLLAGLPVVDLRKENTP